MSILISILISNWHFEAWKDLHRELVSSDDLEASKSARLLESSEREMEYKIELDKIRARVQLQPTLFQRQTRVRLSISVKKISD